MKSRSLFRSAMNRRMHCALPSLLAAGGALLWPLRAAAEGTWTNLTAVAPAGIETMLLLSDGTVMGQGAGTATWYHLIPDATGSYVNGRWTNDIAAMHYSRLYYSSDVLSDGRVFVAGAEYGTGTTNAEIYSPVSNTWSQIPVPAGLITTNNTVNSDGGNSAGFLDSASILLSNGKVLVTPVFPAHSGETVSYDPVANAWTNATLYRGGNEDEASLVMLADNSILVVDNGTQSSERYIPALNKWVNDANVPVSLFDPYGDELGAAFLLPNGNAFFIGSAPHTAIYTPTGTTNAGAWIAGAAIPNNLGAPDAPAAMMANGKILCALSPTPYTLTGTNYVFTTPSYFYEYDYSVGSTGAFTQIHAPTAGAFTLNEVTYNDRMLDLPDGTVLFTTGGSQLYVYTPDGTPLAAGQPSVSSITRNADGSYHLVGKGLNGISQGAAYGDDAQMNSSYPLVRITNGTGVLYARTYDWSSTSVMTSNQTVTTEFVLPQSFLAGVYSLVVVANGNSSAPYSFSTGTLLLTPGSNFVAGGTIGGPFGATSQTYALTNIGAAPLSWALGNPAAWLTASQTNGTLTPGGPAVPVAIRLNSVASNLNAGTYTAVLTWTNLTDGSWQTRDVTLTVANPAIAIPASGYNAGIIVPATATSGNTSDYMTATFGGAWGFYAAGLAAINYTGGNATLEGLPASGNFVSLLDGTTDFQLGPYGTATNVLLLSPHQGFANPGTLTLANPRAYTALAILASSGNGYSGSGGQGTFVLHFTNGSASSPIAFNAQDWYSPASDTALTHFGRIYTGNYGSFYTDNPSVSNPNLYQTTVNLASLGLSTQAISSIVFTMPADTGNQEEDTGIFAICGTPSLTGAAPLLAAKNQTNSTVLLTWSAVTGLRYQLQCVTNLNSTNWVDIGGSIVATNSTLTAVDSPTNAQKFYRLQVLP